MFKQMKLNMEECEGVISYFKLHSNIYSVYVT